MLQSLESGLYKVMLVLLWFGRGQRYPKTSIKPIPQTQCAFVRSSTSLRQHDYQFHHLVLRLPYLKSAPDYTFTSGKLPSQWTFIDVGKGE